jgi:hypothetical protein
MRRGNENESDTFYFLNKDRCLYDHILSGE